MRKHQCLNMLFAAAGALVVAGCACMEKTTVMTTETATVRTKTPPPTPLQTVVPPGDGIRAFIPGGVPECSVIMLEKTAPKEVYLNEEFEYQIHVTNLTDCTIRGVSVKENLSKEYELKGSSPAGKLIKSEHAALWDLGDLAGHETKVIKVAGIARGAVELSHCATVIFDNSLCHGIRVTQPQLMLAKMVPDEVLICDTIPMKLVVSNTGTGTAKEIMVTEKLPDGWVTADGQKAVTFNVPVLPEGASREFEFSVKAEKTGVFASHATAAGALGLTAQASGSTTVRQPVLIVSKQGPDEQFVGRPLRYTINVANKGDGPADHVTVKDALPAGTRFEKASDEGMPAGGQVVWNLGRLEAGQAKELSLVLIATEKGMPENQVTVSGVCAKPVSASVKTSVVGVPGILLEVIDVEDPVEIGQPVKYVITATNQGTAKASGIRVQVELEDSMSFIACGGVTEGVADGLKISFAPLVELAPKAKAVWSVTAKAEKAADARFKVEMTSDQLGRPVMATEATNLY